MVINTSKIMEEEFKDVSTLMVYQLKDIIPETKVKLAILLDRRMHWEKSGKENDFVSEELIEKTRKYIEDLIEVEKTKKATYGTTYGEHSRYNYDDGHWPD